MNNELGGCFIMFATILILAMVVGLVFVEVSMGNTCSSYYGENLEGGWKMTRGWYCAKKIYWEYGSPMPNFEE